MRITTITFLIIVLFSCTDRDRNKEIQGFWVSVDYTTGKPFETLTIGVADSTLFGAIPFFVEVNQYGAYSFIEPLDTIHGRFEAYDPHWNTDFILTVDGDTMIQAFPLRDSVDRIVKYIRKDSIKTWPEVMLGNLLIQVNLPQANEGDKLLLKRRSIVADLFLGTLKTSLKGEHPDIPQDSIAWQVHDVLISAEGLERFLLAEQAKLLIEDRDSIIVVLNADDKIPEQQINEWVSRIKNLNPNLRVWRRCLDYDQRKFLYRQLFLK